jgi:glycosyltransferase involved in cell wall biosynthesis
VNIWLVSIFENTPLDDNQNTRYNSLVREALSRGHRVTFWASTFRHNVKAQRYPDTTPVEPEENLEIVYVKSKPYRTNISLQRLYSHYALATELIKAFSRAEAAPDAILVAFPPVSVAHQVVSWARSRGIPCIVDIIDPWPDVFRVHLQRLPNRLLDLSLSPLTRRVTWLMRNATAICAISNQYLDWVGGYLGSTQKPMQCFYPAIRLEEMQAGLAQARRDGAAKKAEQPFTVIYAGSLGFSYDLPTILAAAALLDERYGTDIRFVIAGDGPQKELVETYTRTHDNLQYLGRIPKRQLVAEYERAQLGLTQHIAGATQSVTYKLFDLLGAGLPILNSLESEMKDIILDHEVGLHNAPGDAATLAANIETCYLQPERVGAMRERAQALTARLGDSPAVYGAFLDFIEQFTPVASVTA